MSTENIWIIVPAYNEADVIYSALKPLVKKNYHVIVIDDASTDQTLREIRRLPVDICRHSVNLGQGAALQTGICYALKEGAKYLVMFDADGQHDPGNIPKLLEPLLSGKFDVALGTRHGTSKIGMPVARKRLLMLALWYTRLTIGLRISDTHNGARAFTAAAAKKLEITLNRMAHASQILSQIRSHRMRYKEVPVVVRYTSYSVAKGQKTSDLVNVVWDSMMELFKR